MSNVAQIFKVGALNDLFIDVRYVISQHKFDLFYLNSAPVPVKAQTSLSINYFNLKDPKNVQIYLKLTQHGLLIGDRIRRYDSIMIAFVISRLTKHQEVTTAELYRFRRHLFYLSCTNRPSSRALNQDSSAKKCYYGWLRRHQLIDLHDLNYEPVKLTAAKMGFGIHYLRPIDHIKDSPVLSNFLNYQINQVMTLDQLVNTPEYRDVLQALKHPDTATVNYTLPGFASNYLDNTLKWSLTQAFLPIYSIFKNLQGHNLKFRHGSIYRNHNFNLPYLKTDGTHTTIWLNLGRNCHSVNVDWFKFKLDRHPNLFKRSPRSGNWLINRKYRQPSRPGQLTVDLSLLRHRLFMKLGAITVHINRFTSANVIWQLILWRLGEAIVFQGGTLQAVTLKQLQVSDLSKNQLSRILKSFFNNLIDFKAPLDSLVKPTQLTDWQLRQLLNAKRQQLLSPVDYLQALKFFQIILHVGRWSHQTLFSQSHRHFHNLGTVARFFLIQQNSSPTKALIARVTHANWYQYNNDVNYHRRTIDQVELKHQNGQVRPAFKLNPRQNVVSMPNSLQHLSYQSRNYLYHHLDLEAYLKRFKSTEP